MHLRVRIALLLCLGVVVTGRAGGAEPPRTDRTARLAKLCKVWGTVKFLHPWLWTRQIDWDAALLRALPRARAATTDDDLAASVSGMLGELHDPVTRVAPAERPRPATPRPGGAFLLWPKKGVLMVQLAAPHTPADVDKARAAIKDAKELIVDARLDDGVATFNEASGQLSDLLSGLITRDLLTPPFRWVAHEGYTPQNGDSSSPYQSMFEEQATTSLSPKPDAIHRPLALVLNAATSIPDAVMALQAIGDAAIIMHGTTLDDLITVAGPIPLDANRVVRMRWLEVVPVGVPLHADAELPAEADDATVVATALAKLRALRTSRVRPAAESLPPLVWRAEKVYANEKAPSADMRLLALFRLWTVIDRFYPYKALLDERWNDVLTSFIPRFEAAEGRNAYEEAVADLMTHIPDSHVYIKGTVDPQVNPPAWPRIRARMIEGKPVIVVVGGDEETKRAGLRVGDFVVSADGEPIAARMERFRRFVAASNDAFRDYFSLLNALAGADGSTLVMAVRGADGSTRTVRLVRHTPRFKEITWRSGDVVRILDGNVGYVDLDRLRPAEVDAMFEQLQRTRAIIFDMRGYPNATMFAIASRINVRGARVGALMEFCVVRGNATDEPIRQKILQPIRENTGGKPLYRGKTFMLVDERTNSQSEHTGIFFEAAAGTKFVGSQTAGADGDVTVTTLPGGLSIYFTGLDVRHADGRQLQRVGLPIDYLVKPTLRGVQAGRDEVLDRALQLAR
ncbi:MAG: hypothetical protein JWN44_5113 [Myxococcales bacterium]|nr:hypothetical protein [Myxococcales bacterium]